MNNNKNNNQSSAIDIPPKVTRIVASTTAPDGQSMLSSIVTDDHGHQRQRQGSTTDTGISPTYYTSGGAPVNTDHSHSVGSPVYGDQSRVFFSHNSLCSCKCV